MVLCVDFCIPPRHPDKYLIKKIVGLEVGIVQYVKIILIQRKKRLRRMYIFIIVLTWMRSFTPFAKTNSMIPTKTKINSEWD